MSRRSKEKLAVQLFPFLAVLVCTMGSLIFLLLVTTREIRQRAVAFAAYQLAQEELAAVEAPALPVMSISNPEPPAIESLPIPEPEPMPSPDDGYEAALAQRERDLSELKATWRLRVNQLAKDRDEELSQLARRKSLMAVTAEKTNSLQSEIQQLEVELGRLAGEAVAAGQTVNEAERLLLEQQIAEMKKRLRAAQVADSTAKNDQFQVVPFDPQTGTSRRPILIECTAAGIRFLPEDILITAKDMEGFTHKANPLAAGTGALINYWTVWNMQQRRSNAEAEPYVLLLVRPDGVYAYYVAMKMLDPIRTPQGYELIEDSTVLKLPEVDEGAKTACQTAVNRLLTERESISRAAIRGGTGGAVFGGTSGRRGSGIGQSFGPEKGTNSAEAGDSRRPSGNSFTMNDITGGDEAVGSRSWERVENFQGRPRGPRRGNAADSNAADRKVADQGQREFSGSGQSRGAETPFDEGIEPEIFDDSEFADLQEPQGAAGTANGGPRSRSSTNSRGSSLNGEPHDSSSSGDFEPEPGMPIGERPGHKPKSSSRGSEQASDGQLPESENEFDDVSDAEDGGTGGNSRTRSGDPSKSSALSDNASAPPRYAHDPRNGSRPARPGDKPSKSSDASDKSLEPEMLAGRRWGQCDPGASIGFEREVRVDVSKDKLVIAEKHTVPLGQGESKQETLERFATALDLASRGWGRPPQGFFWAPRLKFVVKPEANANYEQVNAMMTRAGLATSHEFAKDPRSIEFGRANPATTKPAPKTASTLRSGGRQ